ncbi:hypothetical protein C3Y87_01230 [Carbonactinospora thermoautotrophica]|nr:hypothetical protein [Carbonactinospora thermoautotrophica]
MPVSEFRCDASRVPFVRPWQCGERGLRLAAIPLHSVTIPSSARKRKNLLRAPTNSNSTGRRSRRIVYESLWLDLDLRVVLVEGEPLALAFLEFELLAFLLAHPFRVFTRAQLLSAVWGRQYLGETRTVDVHINRLRRKLGPVYRSCIVTVRRVGYKFQPRQGAFLYANREAWKRRTA